MALSSKLRSDFEADDGLMAFRILVAVRLRLPGLEHVN